MPTSVIPALIDALVVAATTALPDVRVSDGDGVTDDYGNFLMIGCSDPLSEADDNAAEASQSWAFTGHTTRDQEGDLTCAAFSWNGEGTDAGQKACRDAAYAIVAAVENLLRVTPPLGVTTLLWTSALTSETFRQMQTQTGPFALVVFNIHFKARI